jgi:hypothetical protein
MITFTGKKIAALIIAALVGGLSGYFGSGLIVDKLEKKKEEEEHKGDFIPFIPSKEEKPKLDELASKYKKDPDTLIISWDQFEAAMNDHQTLYYFEDGVYADENSEQIDHPQTLIGANAHLHFGEESADPDVVYIRNSRLEIDYEIIREKGTYKKEVLGIEEKPKGKPKEKAVKKTRKEDLTDEDGDGN